MNATYSKNIKLLKARQNIGLSITPRSDLTVTTQYRPNQGNIFRLLRVHTTVYNCLTTSYTVTPLALDTRLFNVDKL
jgi:hypothetical protein